MTYQPVIPYGGIRGWQFLGRTIDRQQELFTRTSPSKRDEDHFRARIGSVGTAADLVADRRLLAVALGAFGLGDDIGNRAFLRRVLEDGSLAPGALANRLADKRYLAFAKAFGFGDFDTPRTKLSTFADEVIGQFRTESFEAAVGRQNGDLRLALNAKGELAEIAARRQTDDGRWFSVMGSTALREVFQTAFGLPRQLSAIDLDQQVGVLRDRARRLLGDGEVAQFADAAKVEKLVRLYLARAEATQGASGAATAALSLLRDAGRGSPG